MHQGPYKFATALMCKSLKLIICYVASMQANNLQISTVVHHDTTDSSMLEELARIEVMVGGIAFQLKYSNITVHM